MILNWMLESSRADTWRSRSISGHVLKLVLIYSGGVNEPLLKTKTGTRSKKEFTALRFMVYNAELRKKRICFFAENRHLLPIYAISR